MITSTVRGNLKSDQSVTGPQVLFRPMEFIDQKTAVLNEYGLGSLTYTKIREMRKDSTISMVRQLIIAPALLAPWNFKASKEAPEEAVEFIKKQFEELRTWLLRKCFFGCIDYGWQTFEKTFGKQKDGKIIIAKWKPIIPDHSELLIDKNNGDLVGLREWNTWTGEWKLIRLNKLFLHSFDVEGTYWYGHSYMANVEDPYDQWKTSNEANVRYDTKIAGSHWVVHYPMGVSLVNGEEKDNEIIAQDILASLQSSGGIAVPKKLEEFLTELDKETPNSWVIELISDKGATQTAFLDRMAYLDRLKVRAFGFPERSILEGKYGTKAEAETHADFAVTNILLRTEDLLRDLNINVVDQLLELNFGPEAIGTVRIQSGSIGSDNKNFLREIYKELIKDTAGFTSEMAKMDLGALREVLMIPTDPGADDEESDIFEKKLEKLEDQLDQESDDGIFNANGSGDDLRTGERGEVGRPDQFGRPTGNLQPSNMGDLAGRREDGRSAKEQSLRDPPKSSVRDRN